jgi:hypothetical protein
VQITSPTFDGLYEVEANRDRYGISTHHMIIAEIQSFDSVSATS